MSDNPAKSRYALGLLSALEELREESIVCDFAIKVGNESFPVHLTVLVATSKYFRAMAESRMVEVKQGFITMKDMEANVIRICIKHMYTGEAELVSSPVESILEAAHLMQQDDLVNSCFIHLRNNISAENCISTVSLSRLYDRHDIEELAEKYILGNLGEISQIESFSSISEDDIVRYLSAAKAGHQVLWRAVIAWVHQKQEEHREQLLVELMEVVKIEAFPFEFLFEKIVSEDPLNKCKPARDRVIKAMFSHEEVKSSLTVENVFVLRRLIQESNLTEKDKKLNIIKDFVVENFEDVIEKEDFVQLEEDDISMFLRSPDTKCSSEFKWKAMLKWTKFERKRKTLFATFFKLIQLEGFSNKFIRNEITNEPMVKESAECLELIVQALCDRAESATIKIVPTPCIAFLDHADGGTVKLFDVNQTSCSILSRLDNLRGKQLYNCGIVNCIGDIYVLVRQALYKLDRRNTWIELRTMPGKSSKPKMITFHDSIFVLVGGAFMASYNTAENEWLADLPGCGIDGGYCIVSSETSLVALGGRRGGEHTNEVKKFDPTNRSWSNLPPMLNKRSSASAAMLHQSIVVAGGVGDRNYTLNYIECFSRLTRSWSALPNMNSCHSGFTLLVICDKLYVCGGDIDADARKYKDKGTIEVYNEDNAEWKTLKKEKAFQSCFIACAYYPKN